MKKEFANTSLNEQNRSSEHDSMLGGLLFESFCGVALGELMAEATNMPEWARELDWSNGADLYDEYSRDRANRGFKLGVNGALNGMFNRLGIIFNLQKPVSSPLPAYRTAATGQGSYATAPGLAHGFY